MNDRWFTETQAAKGDGTAKGVLYKMQNRKTNACSEGTRTNVQSLNSTIHFERYGQLSVLRLYKNSYKKGSTTITHRLSRVTYRVVHEEPES